MTEEEQKMIDDCQNRDFLLGEWEAKFIDDIEARGEPLTEKQHAKLTQIWDRVTS